MRLSGIVLGLAAAAMASLPAVAATAPVTVNPAARLSLASVHAVGRASTVSKKKKSSLAGAALVIAIVAGAAVAAGVVAVATEDNSSSS